MQQRNCVLEMKDRGKAYYLFRFTRNVVLVRVDVLKFDVVVV